MIVRCFLFLLICLSLPAFGQFIPEAHMYEPGGSFSNPAALLHQLRLDEHWNLQADAVKQSPAGNHTTFLPYINGLPVYGREMRVHTDKNNRILLVTENLDKYQPVPSALCDLQQAKKVVLESNWKIDGAPKAWIFPVLSGEWKAAWQIPGRRKAQLADIWVDSRLHIIAEVPRGLGHHEPDSLVNAWVFYPDPLSSAGVPYGDDYVDNNDADNAALNAERKLKTLRVAFTDDTFRLRNDYGSIVDFEPPNNDIPWSLTPEFDYTRSQQGFEAINALYHITQAQLRLQQLGFSNLMHYPIRIDPQGRFETDNSVFLALDSVVSFGEGGIDDAEDADPIVHEYTHAIAQDAAPGTVFGTQREGVEEGNADFMASSYSLAITTYDAEKVYNWDGNDSWEGRYMRTAAIYPSGISGNPYNNGTIWAEALYNLRGLLGRDTTETLLLQSIYFYGKNLSMPQMAQLVLKADSLLYESGNTTAIYQAFHSKGILDWPAGIENTSLPPSLLLLNSAAFAAGTGPLRIISVFETPLVITDVSGRILLETPLRAGEPLQLEPAQWAPGVYYARAGNKVLSWVRN